MNQYPEPVVGAFIVNNNNELFLMKSPKFHDLYIIPGGHIELGETIQQALKREVKEETNLDITHPTFLSVDEFIYGEEYYDKRHMIFLDYRVEAVSSDVILNNEAKEYVWVSQDDVFKLPLEEYTKKILEKFNQKIFILPSPQAK